MSSQSARRSAARGPSNPVARRVKSCSGSTRPRTSPRLDDVRGRAAMLDADTFTSPGEHRSRGARGRGRDGRRGGRAVRAPSAGDGVRPSSGTPRRARGRHGVLLPEQRGDCGGGRPRAGDRHASPSWTSTCTMEMAPKGRSRRIRAFCSSRSTNGRSIRAPERSRTWATARVRGSRSTSRIDAGATDADYAHVFERIVEPIADEFAAGLVLVSAGFDAHERDPAGAHASHARRVRVAGVPAGTAR